jgi:hypothetical protein
MTTLGSSETTEPAAVGSKVRIDSRISGRGHVSASRWNERIQAIIILSVKIDYLFHHAGGIRFVG